MAPFIILVLLSCALPAVYPFGTTGNCEQDFMFQCNNDQCVYYNWVCDGDDDCGDGSDEECGCMTDEFQCETVDTCIPATWRCDGDPDCGDGSDEDNCAAMRRSNGKEDPLSTGNCEQDFMFQCNNNQCVYYNWVCDGDDDCDDGSDEECGCMTNEFQCETVDTCIPATWRCDGDPDCDDGSDEDNCAAMRRSMGKKYPVSTLLRRAMKNTKFSGSKKHKTIAKKWLHK